MSTDLLDSVAPTERDRNIARESSRLLSRLDLRDERRFQVAGEPDTVLEIPESALRLLLRILSEMAEGNAVSVVPLNAELTTQEAADLIGVSRPYLIKLLDSGKLRCHKVGTHRRVLASDLLEYKNQSDMRRSDAIEELTRQAQELGLGYD